MAGGRRPGAELGWIELNALWVWKATYAQRPDPSSE